MFVNYAIILLFVFHQLPFFKNKNITISYEVNESLPFNFEKKEFSLHILPFI